MYQVYNYTGQKYSELPNCRFGWMERQDVNSGEIFEPKTVQMKMDLTAESTVAIPVIFDCVERKFIWCDMNLSLERTSSYYGGNNLESNLSGVAATCYAMSNLNKPNIYDLVMLNVMARGIRTNDRNDADIILTTIRESLRNRLMFMRKLTELRHSLRLKPEKRMFLLLRHMILISSWVISFNVNYYKQTIEFCL